MTTYVGSCHCGRINFEVDGDLTEVSECNCSICTKKGFLHWIVPQESFRLRTSMDEVVTYRFHTMTAKHYFCRTCGIAPFYIARSDPDKVDVNARCLDGIEIDSLRRRPFDGRNWEQAIVAHRVS